nr:uncharacterized protein LOC105856503 isoform X2 [Microcebus murinus]
MMSDRELRYVSLDISEFAENPADEEGEEEKEPQMNDQSSELDFLVEVQVREVTWLHHLLRKGREASSVLSGHLQALLTHEHPEDPQGQGGREHLAEGRRLAEGLTRSLSPEHYEDEEEEEDLESLASSVLSELQEDTWSCGLSQALSEQDVPPGADLSDCQEPTRSATSLSDGPEVGSVPDGAGASFKPQAAARHPGDRVSAAAAGPAVGSWPWLSQVQPTLQPGSLAASADSAPPRLPFPGVQLRLPPRAQTVSPLLAGPRPLKPRMSERKSLFSQWRVACSFPGLRLQIPSTAGTMRKLKVFHKK